MGFTKGLGWVILDVVVGYAFGAVLVLCGFVRRLISIG